VLILLIPVGGVGIVAVLGGQAAGLTWNPLTVAIAVVAGLIVISLLIFLMSMISVPATVFFPAYSIYFFSARYAPLHDALNPGKAEP
jgi:hypothetical protein